MRIGPRGTPPPQIPSSQTPSPAGVRGVAGSAGSPGPNATSPPPELPEPDPPAARNARIQSSFASNDIAILEEAFGKMGGVDPASVGWKSVARAATLDPTRAGAAPLAAGKVMSGPEALNPAQKIQYGRLVSALKSGDIDGATKQFAQFAAEHRGSLSQDVSSLVRHALRDSYPNTVEELRHHGQRIKHLDEQKQQIRSQLQMAHGGNAHAEAIQELEGRLSSVADDAQLANIEMQNWLQKSQQTLQLLSNMAKSMHDTAMNSVRKMGG